MKKLAIFNVGGAFSSYGEFNDKKFIMDLGAGNNFSPVDNFLLPLAHHRNFQKNKDGYFIINQLFLSHLDMDHISDYVKFRQHFLSDYMSCPNDNLNQDEIFKINIDILKSENSTINLVLEDMRLRNPVEFNMPLASIIDEITLHYIKPGVCEKEENLLQGYDNNISLVLFLHVGEKTVLLPGDILKEGNKFLIDNDIYLKNILTKKGVDYLVAPHHGLQTSFSEYLFQTMNGNKTRLNIISEKVRKEDSEENRSDVDLRYYSSNYSSGDNTLEKNGVKTSLGHIVIDFETDETQINQYVEIDDVLKEFC